MKKISYIFSVICMYQSVFAQFDTTKYDVIWTGTDSVGVRKQTQADILARSGDFSNAVVEYKKLIKADPTDETYIYNMSCVYSIINELDSAYKYLKLALVKDSNLYVLIDPDFYTLSKDKRWQEIGLEQINKAETLSNKKLKNKELTLRLYNILMKDQAYYSEIEIMEEKFGRKSKQVDSLWKLKDKLNKENVLEIEQIIKKHGWPKISEFGSMAANAAFVVIQHADEKLQKKYLPQLKRACKQNEADWQNYALMKDRILVSENKPQLYGSQVKYNEAENKYELCPLSEPEKVDARRAKLGMGPLKQYLLNWDIKFNVIQKN